MKWHSIQEIHDLTKPFLMKVNVANKNICIVGYKGGIFALSAICPHQGFDLGKGACENGKLICPVHGYSFDLKTGEGDVIK
jgi:nitrite reductase/ring-hydroxylating ferredoxin subunit